MSIATEYMQRVKNPRITTTITTFEDGTKPSVDPPWYGTSWDYYPETISCNLGFGYDQGCATCSLTIKTPYDGEGNPIIFKPMDKVVIRQGWTNVNDMMITFFGFIDGVSLTDFPKMQTLKCRDILKLTNNYYFVYSNRVCYYYTDYEDTDGTIFPGKSESDRYAEKIIQDLLLDSGVPLTRQDLEPAIYYVNGTPVRLVIGNHKVFMIEYRSAMDAINAICELVGYRIWATSDGIVKLRWTSPYASENASLSYSYEPSTTKGHLLNVTSKKSDTALRNRIEVRGYTPDDGNQITATKYADSIYVPTPPQWRRAEVASDFIDTQGLATWTASSVFNDLNRLAYTASADIEGDPRLQIGQTVEIIDDFAVDDGMKYFLYDYSSSMSVAAYRHSLGLVGGIGSGSEANVTVPPIACFGYEFDEGSLTILCNANISYDPDGSISGYLWVAIGYANGSGITQDYVISDPSGVTSLVVTLTVTDWDNLTDSSVQTITWSGI